MHFNTYLIKAASFSKHSLTKIHTNTLKHTRQIMRKSVSCHRRTTKAHMSLGIHPVWSVFTRGSMSSLGSEASSCGHWRLIRLGRCLGRSEALLGAQVILLCRGSHVSHHSSLGFMISRKSISFCFYQIKMCNIFFFYYIYGLSRLFYTFEQSFSKILGRRVKFPGEWPGKAMNLMKQIRCISDDNFVW